MEALPILILGFLFKSNSKYLRQEYDFKFFKPLKSLVVLFTTHLMTCNFTESLISYKQLDRLLDDLYFWMKEQKVRFPSQDLFLEKSETHLIELYKPSIQFKKANWVDRLSSENQSLFNDHLLNVISILAYFLKTGNLALFISKKISMRNSIYFLYKLHYDANHEPLNFKKALLSNK